MDDECVAFYNKKKIEHSILNIEQLEGLLFTLYVINDPHKFTCAIIRINLEILNKKLQGKRTNLSICRQDADSPLSQEDKHRPPRLSMLFVYGPKGRVFVFWDKNWEIYENNWTKIGTIHFILKFIPNPHKIRDCNFEASLKIKQKRVSEFHRDLSFCHISY